MASAAVWASGLSPELPKLEDRPGLACSALPSPAVCLASRTPWLTDVAAARTVRSSPPRVLGARHQSALPNVPRPPGPCTADSGSTSIRSWKLTALLDPPVRLYWARKCRKTKVWTGRWMSPLAASCSTSGHRRSDGGNERVATRNSFISFLRQTFTESLLRANII